MIFLSESQSLPAVTHSDRVERCREMNVMSINLERSKIRSCFHGPLSRPTMPNGQPKKRHVAKNASKVRARQHPGKAMFGQSGVNTGK